MRLRVKLLGGVRLHHSGIVVVGVGFVKSADGYFGQQGCIIGGAEADLCGCFDDEVFLIDLKVPLPVLLALSLW